MCSDFYAIKSDKERQSIETELPRELATGHPLFGLPLTAIYRRNDDDDVLFQVNDGSGRVAEVHLTWRGDMEKLPWPISRFFESFDDWKKTNRRAEL